MLPDFHEPCILHQDDARGEPMVLLRRAPGAIVEVMTVERAHALLDEFGVIPEDDPAFNNADNYWWFPLDDLLRGIR